MLDAAGFKRGPNGIRVSPAGKPLTFTLETGSTSSDYVQSSQNVAADVKKIGINLVVTPKAWNTVISDVELGHFQVAHMFEQLGTTPYTFYDFYMSCDNVVKVGKTALQNWGRFCDPKATTLLGEVRRGQHPVGSAVRSPTSCRPSSPRSRRSSRCSPSRTGASSTPPGSPASPARPTRTPRARRATRAPCIVLTTVRPKS